MSFRETLKDNRSRIEHSRDLSIVYFLTAFFVAFTLTYILFENDSKDTFWLTYIFHFPDFKKFGDFYYFFGAVFLGTWIWWYGLSKIVVWILDHTIFLPTAFLEIKKKMNSSSSPILKKVILPILNFILFWWIELIGKIRHSKAFAYVEQGERDRLDDFFYQKIEFSDELKRAKKFIYLKSRKYTIENMFDYDPLSMKIDKNGTNRIISLFRDKDRERLINLGRKEKDKKKRKKIIARIKAYDKNIIDSGMPTENQQFVYDDLMRSIEGMMQGYANSYNKIETISLPSPLSFEWNKNNHIAENIVVDENIDVFANGKVYFSFDMVVETVMKMSVLYASSIVAGNSMNTGIYRKREKKLTRRDVIRYCDYFKIMFFRRLVMNYGGIPSGWFAGRFEDYTARAIVSAIDRPMVPVITQNNDGSSIFFSDDTEAKNFLLTYWQFMIKKSDIITAVDWCFNATKSTNETEVREYAKKEAVTILKQQGFSEDEIEQYFNPTHRSTSAETEIDEDEKILY